MSGETLTSEKITPDMMIPNLLSRHPQARPVFNRYGLNGCGGQLGPVESIGFFARTHGVDEQRLLAELTEAMRQPVGAADDSKPSVADAIYRRFFTAGIVLVLTAGATWGAWLLWQIGIRGAFTSISIFQVNAHGHAQIFGWVGLFIMGFAYQAFPRMWHTPLAAPRLAAAAFLAMLTGLVVQVTAMTLAGQWSYATPVAVIGNVLQIAAILAFAGQLAVTYARSDKPFEPYVAFAFAAVGWFVIMSVFTLWHTYQTMAAGTREQLLWYVATYQAPLRDLQVHGLALFMILGVCLRMLPALFDLPAVPQRRAWTSLALLTIAVLSEVVLFIVYRWTQQHAWAGLMWLSWVLLVAGVALIAWPWRLWRPMPSTEAQFDRSAKFIRAAYGWLAVSLFMLLMLPVYQVISGIPFSHAYYGAIRHAITVGFISLMIMGFAAKVVPTLNGIDTRTLSPLWGPFILVNLGCFLRVSTQTLTDWHPAFFAVIGLSGTLEVIGLGWWGVGLIRVMVRGKREAAATHEQTGPRPASIEPTHRVADVLNWFPATEPVFLEFGFSAIKHAVFRRTMARQVTLAQACRMHNIDAEAFVAALNRAASAGETCGTRTDRSEFVQLNVGVGA
ncbi:MAG TPA: DUF1858 domain-containing protein [Phycisphaerae bacterium]|nr:DUF1858 domain-containing protein [Phycisphaerae bacterium]HPP26368.1 DUF1858 domain-containing protein [Phycisphaerae bacterium]